MKKTMLRTALVALISTQVYAEAVAPQAQPEAKPQQAAAPATAEKKPSAPVMNCDFKIPSSTKKVDPVTVNNWAEKAITQAFDLDHKTLDNQLQQLQTCFTEQGWQGFNAALQKSGNIEAIKSQKLNLSSQIDGKIEVLEAKDNEWKMLIPLQAVYQNDKEKVTQLLQIKLAIGRKKNGNLGIIQIVATPRSEEAPKANPAPATAEKAQAGSASL